MKTRRYALPVLGAIIVCLVIAGFAIAARVRADAPSRSTGGRFVPRASVVAVKRGTIANSLSIAGEFLPYQEVELHAKVAGYIRRINVDIGDRVRAGPVLAVLEVPELAAQVEGADAGVRHSQDEIVRAQN